MACKLEARKNIENLLSKWANPDVNNLTIVEARKISQDINKRFNTQLTISDVGISSAYRRVRPIIRNIDQAVEFEYNRLVELESTDAFNLLERNAESSSVYINSEGDILPSEYDLLSFEDEIDELYNEGTITNYC